MASAEDRRLAHRNSPPPMPGGNPMDDLSVPGLDTSEDLMDSLISEAGEFSEEAILATGLPEDYDPSGGFDAPSQGGAQAGRVFRLDGSGGEPAAPAAGSTRVGLLPKVGRQQVPVVSKLAAPQPAPEPAAEQESEAEAAAPEAAPDDLLPDDLLPDDLLPPDDFFPEEDEGPAPSDLPVFRPEMGQELDDELMAELSEGVRATSTHAAAPRPLPVPAAAPALHSAAEPATTAPAPRLPFPSMSGDVALPLPRIAPGIEVLRPGDLPGPSAWVCPLDGPDDDAFLAVRHSLVGDLHLSQATLLPICGGTPRAAALKRVISAARPGLRISSTHQLQHREAGEALLFYASSRIYSHGDTHGLLLVEAAKHESRAAVRRLCLFDPSLLLG